MCLAPSQSQRDCVLQPRVARNELPWVGGPLNLNPERVPSKTLNRYPLREERGGERRPFNAGAYVDALHTARVWILISDLSVLWTGHLSAISSRRCRCMSVNE